MKTTTRIESWPMLYPFRISGYEWTHQQVIVAEIESGGVIGRGEAGGVYYKHDTPQHCAEEIERVAPFLQKGADRTALLALLPPGGARNALDCALWDLHAKQQGRPVWQLAGLSEPPHAVLTTFTLGADDPERMADRATSVKAARALKLKLTGTDEDALRVQAVRAARPDVWLGVDANQGFTLRSLERLMPVLVDARVCLLEQPFPIDRDADLAEMRSPIPVAADESVQDSNGLERLAGLYDVVNIKLDKCGGLTAGLAMETQARRAGLKTMVGCMSGTSLAMAAAFILAQRCEITDLDGPTLLASDRSPSVVYENGCIMSPPELWGNPA